MATRRSPRGRDLRAKDAAAPSTDDVKVALWRFAQLATVYVDGGLPRNRQLSRFEGMVRQLVVTARDERKRNIGVVVAGHFLRHFNNAKMGKLDWPSLQTETRNTIASWTGGVTAEKVAAVLAPPTEYVAPPPAMVTREEKRLRGLLGSSAGAEDTRRLALFLLAMTAQGGPKQAAERAAFRVLLDRAKTTASNTMRRAPENAAYCYDAFGKAVEPAKVVQFVNGIVDTAPWEDVLERGKLPAELCPPSVESLPDEVIEIDAAPDET